ncbi:MAG: hypothetical protein SP1CHLAM54_09600 [Chlamydiia bacterium]|nr:hypothetical protein [Chlamydiia bacterium]MCH9615866.1 hypothetical protein [Chlamydiia bacterium]MCH9628731.1 hypothetical protein [Chlamydiia bacterium]
MAQTSTYKICSQVPLSENYSGLSTFIEEVETLLQKEQIEVDAAEKFPYIDLHLTKTDPVCLSVRIICKHSLRLEPGEYVKKLLTKWLLSGRILKIVSQRQVDFYYEINPHQNFLALEFLVACQDEKDRSRLDHMLPSFKDELKQGLQSTSLAYRILNAKGLSEGDKDRLVLSEINMVSAKKPHEFDKDLMADIEQSLFQCPGAFKEIREVDHLSRLFTTHYLFKKSLVRQIRIAQTKRHVSLKILRTKLRFPFGIKNVLGLVVSINLLRNREVLEEQHIIEAVRGIVPACQIVKGSFLSYQGMHSPVRNLYLEIEHSNRKDFTYNEIQQLRQRLPTELKQHIEHLIPMTFMRRNEEEVFRNILTLREQLKSVKDLPQVIINFEEQTHTDLFYTVLLVRPKDKKHGSVRELFETAFPNVEFIPDRIDIIGKLTRKVEKEANVFRIRLEKAEFYRKDRSVDLYKARQTIVNYLETIFGGIRDFNGGLILKQDERLKDFIDGIEHQNLFLLENFFYAITPIAMQSILPPILLKAFYSLFNEVLEDAPEESVVYRHSESNTGVMFMFRTDEPGLKDVITNLVNTMEIPSTELATVSMNVHGVLCFGLAFLSDDPSKRQKFVNVIEQKATEWMSVRKNHQHLRLNIGCAPHTLDPRITRTDHSHMIVKMLYEGLTRIGPDKKPQPAIAKEIKCSDDGLTYTFHLRDSKWTDGSPITAHDFEYSWKKVLETKTHSIYSYTLHVIKNARRAQEKEVSMDQVGIHAIDDRTLVVELEYPVSYFFELTSHWTYLLINSRIDKNHPGWAYHDGETYVCNGPFMLKKWRHNREIILEKNPGYWDADSVNIEKVTISMVDNPHTELKMFENGEIDFMGFSVNRLPDSYLDEINTDFEKIEQPLAGVYCYWFNVKHYPFSNKKIRKALSYAIDRSKIAPNDLIAKSILPTGFTMLEHDATPYGDLDLARKLFKEGMAELNLKEFPPIKLSFSSSRRLQASMVLKTTWESVFGIRVDIEDMDWNTLYQSISDGRHEIAGMAWYSWFWDPHYTLDCFTHTSNQHNPSKWEHPQYRDLIEKSNKILDKEERKHLLKQAEELLLDEMPVIPLYQCTNIYLKKPHMHGVYTSELFDTDFKWAYISGRE